MKEEQKSAIKQLFPIILTQIKDLDKIKEKYNMTEYNENFTNTFATGGNRPDENEEQDDKKGPQVSCQNQ